jgi:hypothetical protein
LFTGSVTINTGRSIWWPEFLAKSQPVVDKYGRELKDAFRRWDRMDDRSVVRPLGWKHPEGITFFLTEFVPGTLTDAVRPQADAAGQIEVLVKALEQMARLLISMRGRPPAPCSGPKLRWSQDLGFCTRIRSVFRIS